MFEACREGVQRLCGLHPIFARRRVRRKIQQVLQPALHPQLLPALAHMVIHLQARSAALRRQPQRQKPGQLCNLSLTTLHQHKVRAACLGFRKELIWL